MNEAIINNFVSQLLAVQAQIMEREQPIPTLQELNLQVKLINAIDKMQRIIDRKARKDAKEAKAAQANATKSLVLAATPSGDQEYINGDPPPISSADFEKYQLLLLEEVAGNNDTMVRFGDGYVNRKWLVYNLFQYCLPVADRLFINNVARFRKNINTSRLAQMIRVHMQNANAA